MVKINGEKMKKSQAYALLIISGFLFATSGIFVRRLSPYGFSSLQIVAFRGGVSAIVFCLFALIRDKKIFKTNFKSLLLFAVNGILMFFSAYFYYSALEHTTIATAVVLLYTSPIYVLIFSVIFLKEKFSLTKLLSILVMIVGVALSSGFFGNMSFEPFGVLCGLLSGVSFGIYSITTKLSMKMKNDPFTSMLYCYIIMAALAITFANVTEMPALISKAPLKISLLSLGVGLFTCAIPYLMHTFSLKIVPASTAGALGLIDPMASIIYGILFFKEPLSFLLVCGIVMILGSVFVISRIKE